MMMNKSYYLWKEHEGHAIVVFSTEDLDRNSVVIIHCNYCRKAINMYELAEEYEVSNG
jgi:hypothetical protein